MNRPHAGTFRSVSLAAVAALAVTLSPLRAASASDEAAPRAPAGAPILIVAPAGTEATAARLTAELGALGVRVVAMLWPGEPPAVEALADLVQATGASAALRIVPGGGSLELWLAGAPAGTIALAETLVVSTGTVDRSAALAVRAAEALRARLLVDAPPPATSGDLMVPDVALASDADPPPVAVPVRERTPPSRPPSPPKRVAPREASVATTVPPRLRRPWGIASVAPSLFVDSLYGAATAVPLLSTRLAFLFTPYTAVTAAVLAPTVPVPVATPEGQRGLSVLAVQTGVRGVFSPLRDAFSLTLEVGGLYFRKRESSWSGWSTVLGLGFYGSGGFVYRFHRFFALFSDVAITVLLAPSGSPYGTGGLLATAGIAFTL